MNNNLLYTVEDKPPFGLSLLLAAQHLLAALGGNYCRTIGHW